jgi:hypothetical protein
MPALAKIRRTFHGGSTWQRSCTRFNSSSVKRGIVSFRARPTRSSAGRTSAGRAKISVGTLYSKARSEKWLNGKPAWPAAPHEHCWLMGCIFAGFANEHRAISAPSDAALACLYKTLRG